MALLSTGDVGRLLGVSAATVKRLSIAGKISCVRGANGTRAFRLEDVGSYLGHHESIKDAMRGGRTDDRVAALIRVRDEGTTLAQAFDEMVLPVLAGATPDDLSFIERCEPLAAERHPRTAAPTAIILSAAADGARPRMAACLLRGLGYRVPALSRDAQVEVLRVVACADPDLVVAIEPHRPDLALLREQLPPLLERVLGCLLVDGAGNDFSTLREFVALARIRIAGPRVANESNSVPERSTAARTSGEAP